MYFTGGTYDIRGKNVSIMTANPLKTSEESTPETSCISNIIHTMGNIVYTKYTSSDNVAYIKYTSHSGQCIYQYTRETHNIIGL